MLGSIKRKLGSKKEKRTDSVPVGSISVFDTQKQTPISTTHYRPPVTHRGPAELSANVADQQSRVAAREAQEAAELAAESNRNIPTIVEPPPAYAVTNPPVPASTLHPSGHVPRASSPSPSVNSIQSQMEEDPYAFLSSFDTLILIDDSGSMAGRSWREVRAALSSLLPVVLSHDKDGIDIFFLNHKSKDAGDLKEGIAPSGYRNVSSTRDVERIFDTVRPNMGTPTGTRLRAILKPYLAKLEAEDKKGKMDEVKPLNILAITDGVPSDDVESVIINAAKKLDALDAAPHQVGIQFFQVGNEQGAAAALQELDDELGNMVEGGVRDIVDTCTWTGGSNQLTGEGILKVVLGAVVKRLDRRRADARRSQELRR